MDRLSKDELYVLSLHLDLPDLLLFCRSYPAFYRKICRDPTVWLRKIKRDYPAVILQNLAPEIRNKSYKEIYILLYTEKIYNGREVELFADEDIHLPEHLYLPNLEAIYIYFNFDKNGEEIFDKHHKVVIPESVNFPNLQNISVFPNENDDNYYNIKVPDRFANIVETEHND